MKVIGSCLAALAVAVLGTSLVLMNGTASADETTVVVSRPGTVFHLAGSSDIRGRGHSRTLSEAMAAGYTPCPSCFAKEARTSRSLTVSTSGSTTLSATAFATAAAPGLGPITSPFGLKQGTGNAYRVSMGDTGRDPYTDLATIVNPGAEQGAYCSCPPPECDDRK